MLRAARAVTHCGDWNGNPHIHSWTLTAQSYVTFTITIWTSTDCQLLHCDMFYMIRVRAYRIVLVLVIPRFPSG